MGTGTACIVGSNYSPISCSMECDKYTWCFGYTVNRSTGECILESSCANEAIVDCADGDRFVKNVVTIGEVSGPLPYASLDIASGSTISSEIPVCKTIDNEECVFPFKVSGTSYRECISFIYQLLYTEY